MRVKGSWEERGLEPQAERLMQTDYTRKTQEVAEQRKAIEAERERVETSPRI